MTPRDPKEIFEADDNLLIAIIDQVYKLKRFCYLCDIALLVFSGYMYNRFGKDVPFFIVCELIAIACLGAFQYFLLSPKSKFINRVIIDVRLIGAEVMIRTAAFDGPLWFKESSKEYLFRRSTVAMTMINDPQPHVFKTTEQILLVRHRDQDLYILPRYFNKQLLEELVRVM